jgi:hypothetical protein
MSGQELSHVAGKSSTPIRVLETHAAAIWSADPRNNSESGERIEEMLNLRRIHCGQTAVRARGAEVREYIADVMSTQLCGQSTHDLRVAVTNQFVGFAVTDEPLIAAQPAVGEPDGVVPAIVASVAHVKPGIPEQITKTNNQ